MAANPFAALNKACVNSFGSAVSYQQDTATPFSVQGIVMKDSDEERLRDGLYARLFVDAADFTTPPKGITSSSQHPGHQTPRRSKADP
jgi:hypothetical protein